MAVTLTSHGPRRGRGARRSRHLRLDLLAGFIADEGGQDIVEYALLSAAMGLAGVAVVGVLANSMSTAYTSWDTTAQSDPLVEMPDPVSP